MFDNHSLPINSVRVSDPFWDSRILNAVERVIPYQWRVLNDAEPGAEKSHAVMNFRIAAGLEEGEFGGRQFQDSDLAKWMEAASFSLMYRDSPEIRAHLDEAIGLLEKAQQPDGYLDTHYILKKPDRKWKELAHGHELYCAGHMLEAAVAYTQVTGDDRFMKVMDRLVDLIDATFGKGPGKTEGYPGHEEIELALMKAYALKQDEKYLRLADYFIRARAAVPGFKENDPVYREYAEKDRSLDASYYQAHKPLTEQESAEGHAVRAMYLFTGAADVALATGAQDLKAALERLWNNVTRRRMYITGGVGSQGAGERFTIDYDLPNDTCYTETCASVGLAMWALRMLRLDPKAEYADIMERALYNNVLSGIAVDGEHYFYVNPLQIRPETARFRADLADVEPSRVKWFGCACCPPNVIRTLTGLGGYVATRMDERIYLHLYVGSQIDLGGGSILEIKTEMPWEGEAEIHAASERAVDLALRIPGYAGSFDIQLDGQSCFWQERQGYAFLTLPPGGTLRISFAMKPQVIAANPHVQEDCGKVCVLRGPFVYCAEEADNGKDLQDIRLNVNAPLSVEKSDLFGGIRVIQAEGWKTDPEAFADDVLYRDISGVKEKETQVTLIPYHLWNNRGEGEMSVWLRA